MVPDHPAYQQILAVFANVGGSLRARDLREALDLPIVSKSTENVRSKLKRPASRGILVETEPGSFLSTTPVARQRVSDQLALPDPNDEKDVNSRTALSEPGTPQS